MNILTIILIILYSSLMLIATISHKGVLARPHFIFSCTATLSLITLMIAYSLQIVNKAYAFGFLNLLLCTLIAIALYNGKVVFKKIRYHHLLIRTILSLMLSLLFYYFA